MQSSKARWVRRTNPCFYLTSFSQPLLQSTRPHGSKAFAQSNLETFWETAVNHPLLHDHPVLHREHWRRYAVPIALHGDGVPVVGIGKAWTKLLNVFSWFSLVGTGTTRSKLFYTYSCWDKICEGSFPDGSLGSALRVLQWSFYWLWLGQWPDRDHKGKALPEFIAIFV